MTEAFSAFADAVMAALASRSHEWWQWQIVEDAQSVELSLCLKEASKMRQVTRRFSQSESPSSAVTQTLVAAQSAPLEKLAPYPAGQLLVETAGPDTGAVVRRCKNSRGFWRVERV